jgi:hypothetical protein
MSEFYKEAILNSAGTQTAFFFDSISDMQLFSTQVIDKVEVGQAGYDEVERYKIQNVINTVNTRLGRYRGNFWYGTRDTNWVGSPLSQFLRSSDLNNSLSALSNDINSIDIEDIDQRRKLQFTEQDIGVFSFDLASLGLVGIYEYYSPLLKSLVDKNLVVAEKDQNDIIRFYYLGNPYIPRHVVGFSEKEAGYYSDILQRLVQRSELIEEVPDDPTKPILFIYPEKIEVPKHEVERRQEIDENGKKRYASTYKKVFIYIPKQKNNVPRIDIIVPVSYSSGTSTDEIYWNTISVLAVASKLTELNIDYRIIVGFGIQISAGTTFCFLNIKNDTENLDVNTVSLAISDGRFFRSEMFRAMYSCQIKSGWANRLSITIGTPITDQRSYKNAYIEFLKRQTNPDDIESSKNEKSKLVIEFALSEQQAMSSYRNIIEQVKGNLQIQI